MPPSARQNVSLGYNLQMKRHGPKLPFDGFDGAISKWLRESEAGKGLKGATLEPGATETSD